MSMEGRYRGVQDVEAPRFLDSRHMKVVRLSALRSGSVYRTGNIRGTHFCWTLSRLQAHIVAGRIMSMEMILEKTEN